MCCFSGKVDKVEGTKIFARDSEKSRQFIVYQMTIQASQDLAMILPIPVPRNSNDDAVKFINLEKYPDFFKDMNAGFPSGLSRMAPMGGMGGFGGGGKPVPLEVKDVGSFEASFVPSIADFSRLDARFRMPEGTWEKLPRYKHYGFAVFQFKQGHQKVHPMAFEFPRVNPDQLFFPTVHIHDGQIHDRAMFDHILYAQFGDRAPAALHVWTESAQPAGMFLDAEKCGDIIDETAHAYMRVIRGQRKNADVLA